MPTKKELIEKLEIYEQMYNSGELSLREMAILKADVGVLKSEFYFYKDQFFNQREEGYLYVNRCGSLREKLIFDTNYEVSLLKKIKQKIYESMSQDEYQAFIKDCKNEISYGNYGSI
jgi:hypothetical protein